jgi:hypothetical protein
MEDKIQDLPVRVSIEANEISADKIISEKKGTVKDVEDMRRLGKQQLFKVN